MNDKQFKLIFHLLLMMSGQLSAIYEKSDPWTSKGKEHVLAVKDIFQEIKDMLAEYEKDSSIARKIETTEVKK